MADTDKSKNQRDPAVELVRQKISAIYAHEPNASAEAEEILHEAKPLSKHQSYMKHLTTSGLSLADIQTKWHEYYSGLPDAEKHAVWQEFYAEHQQQSRVNVTQPAETVPEKDQQTPSVVHIDPEITSQTTKHHSKKGAQTVSQIKQQLLGKAEASAHKKLSKKQHFQSLVFGFGLGAVVLLVVLFSFFNERFIAPFIAPSRQVSSTPIIETGTYDSVDPTPKIIIPKINIEIPIIFDEPSVQEAAVQRGLEKGVMHYATTPYPGEKGNGVYFGHSSSNIFNSGKYKFAFVLLNRLTEGDVFYITRNSKRYAYKVYKREIVKPTAVEVLGGTEKESTATLITCDPPGSSVNRLVVIGEQISPDPIKNVASSVKATAGQPAVIPSNSPSLWSKITNLFR